MTKKEFQEELKNSANVAVQRANKFLEQLDLTLHINWEYEAWGYLGNAIGAFVGGIPISLGYGYQYTALYGSVFTVIGFILLYFFYLRYECIRTNP